MNLLPAPLDRWLQRMPRASWAVLPLAVVALLLAHLSQGASLTVSTTSNTVDGNTGSIAALIANPGADGLISLREAITAANNTAGGPHTVTLPAGTFTLNAALTVSVGLTLQGVSAAATQISGNNTLRPFAITGSAGVVFSNLTIRDGNTGADGGAIRNTNGNLTLTGVKLSSNYSTHAGGALWHGGGILTIVGSDLSVNEARDEGGVIAALAGTVNISSSTLSGNVAGQKGGVLQFSGSSARSFVSNNSTYSGNTATNEGGALDFSDNGALTVTVSNDIYTANTSNSYGGAISFRGSGSTTVGIDGTVLSGNTSGQSGGAINYTAPGNLSLTNSQLSGNAANNYGGGLRVDTGVASVTLSNLTFSGNAAVQRGGAMYTQSSASLTNLTVANNSTSDVAGGGGLRAGSGTLSLRNTIVANNTNGNCVLNGSGIITALSNNLDSGSGCGFPAANGNLSNTNPNLATLANNGGATQTLALNVGSPAIDAGTSTGAPATDQRGASRVGNVDIGAFEDGGVVPGPFTLSGSVFEDANYGGGAGRSLAGSGSSGVAGATVELFNGSGRWVRSTSTAAGGDYSFPNLSAATYFVRVVGSSVRSNRSGWVAGLLPVLTFRTDAASGSVVAVADHVGGINPSASAAAAASSGARFNTSTGVFTSGPTGTAQAFTQVVQASSITGLDFGFNFDTVVNTNDSGQGSLRQALVNANALTADNALAQSGRTAGIEHLVFMVSNGSTGSGGSLALAAGGLRSANNAFTTNAGAYNVATIAPTTALPAVTEALVIDAQAQPGWTSASNVPLIELRGNAAGSANGLSLAAAGSAVRGLVINRFTQSGVAVTGANSTLQGNWIGLDAAGSSAAGSAVAGVAVSSAGNTIGGTSATQRNVVSANGSGNGVGNAGILVTAGNGNLIRGNFVGLNAAGTAALANLPHGIDIASGSNTIGGSAAGAGNVSSGNTFDGLILRAGGNANTVQGNIFGGNAANTAAIANARAGVNVSSNDNTVGGISAGQGNVMRGNTQFGLYVYSDASGNAILGNSIFGNGGLGIDLMPTSGTIGVTANDGLKTAGQPNVYMDYPVFTLANFNAGSLTLAGYVGSAAGQSVFASSRVEVFISDASGSNGSGQTFLGFLTSDANGNFSGTLTGVSGVTPGTTKITGTATDTLNNTSEFGPNFTTATGYTVSGTVFEDANYGGGAGRSRAAASGTPLAGATVELYAAAGTLTASTTTDASGNYQFAQVAVGGSFVRVATSSVRSARSGSVAGLWPVQTWRYDAGWQSTGAVTAEVGGARPDTADSAAAPTLTWTSCASEGGTCSFTGTRLVRYGADVRWTVRIASGGIGCDSTSFGDPAAGTGKTCQTLDQHLHSASAVQVISGDLSGVDFGFNVDTVTNTNDSGQGSLRQAITNANTLGGDASLAQAGRTAAIENLVFMISNGTAAAGLRSSYNFFAAGAATITPASALPGVSAALVLDAQTQPGWTAAPIVELRGGSAGAGSSGLVVSGAGSTVRGLAIGGFGQSGLFLNASNVKVEGSYVGIAPDGLTVRANGTDGVYLNSGTGVVIGGNTAAQRNVLSGNAGGGVRTVGGVAVITGNHIGTDAGGTVARGNANWGVIVGGGGPHRIGGPAAGEGNVISGQTTINAGGVILTGSGHTVQGNTIGLNAARSAAIPNGVSTSNFSAGVDARAGSGHQIGGVNAGEGNVIAGNQAMGVRVTSSSTRVLRNSIYSNARLGIDLGGDNVTVNTGTVSAGLPNNGMNTPVLTAATYSGSTLGVAGYVGSAAGQSTFSGARVEVFVSDNDASGYGQGQTYLGVLTTDASGNFSGNITGVSGVTVGSTRITATATDGSNNTSEFGPNLMLGQTLGGVVFEDANYSGGAGRSLAGAGAGGTGVAGARLELYDSSGAFVRSTTTTPGGGYVFSGLAAGNYAVRVVSATVLSQRSGSVASLLPVLTYRTTAASGSAVAVTDNVGGTNPAAADPGAASAGAVLSTGSFVYSAGLSGTAHAVAPVTLGAASITGMDFGFNFDTVVNTNDSGQGSLRRAITNANTLGGDASLAQAGRAAGVENIVFMISNGSTGSGGAIGLAGGLRSTLNYLVTSAGAYTVATVSPASALPALTTAMVIDAQTQPGWTANPLLELNGSGAGSSSGFTLAAAGSTLRGFVVNRFAAGGVSITAGGNHTVQGCWVGLSAGGSSAAGNTGSGISITGSGSGIVVGGVLATQRNVVSGNSGSGITAGGSTSVLLQGNHVGTNAAGTAAVGNLTGIHVASGSQQIGSSAAGAGNLVSGNTGVGIRLLSAASGSSLQGNVVGLNTAGSAALANATGVQIDCGSNCTVGGTAAGQGNVVSGNTGVGVLVGSGQGHAIQGNRIDNNGGLGIDLGGDGVSVNDGSTTAGAPNLLTDQPVFTAARVRGNQLTVGGYVGSAAGQSAFATQRVEIFVSDNDPSGYGEGSQLLGALTTDASGNFSGTLTMPVATLAIGTRLSATATSAAGNTSEFGPQFSNLLVDMVVNSTLDEADSTPGDGLCRTASGVCTLRAAIAELNVWATLPATPSVVFALPACAAYGAAGCSIAPATALPSMTRVMLIDGQTQAGFSAVSNAPIVEVDGSGAPANVNGVVMAAAGSTLRGLAVVGFGQSGVSIGASTVTVEGCYIGLRSDGTTARANGAAGSVTGGVFITGGSGIVIGGDSAAQRNVLSGNGGSGVWLNAGSATVTGNLIGTNASGNAAVGNGRWGVVIQGGTHQIGGAAAGQGNVISGNVASGTGGMLLGAAGQTIQGNTIGLNQARTAAIPNGDGSATFASGIDVRGGSGHLIGGTGAGEGNVVAGNQGHGVRVTGQTTRILGNSIYGNLWLGIDLNADGVTANDGSTSSSQANNGMDHPVSSGAGLNPAGTALSVSGIVGTGTGQAVFAGARVELFKSDGDSSGYGEGRTYLGALTADANGRFSGTLTFTAGTLTVGDAITGTATDAAGNTSEFGPNFTSTTLAAMLPSRFNVFESSTLVGSTSGVIKTKTVGVAALLDVIAIDSSGTAVSTAFTGSVTLHWLDARDNSGAFGSDACRSSWVVTAGAGTLSFTGGTARKSGSFTPPAVGREWRLRVTHTPASGSPVVSCSGDNFAVRPAALAISAIGDSNDTAAAAGAPARSLMGATAAQASGGPVHRAGRPFSLRAAAVDGGGTPQSGYDGAPTVAMTACVQPAGGCVAGSLSMAAVAVASGAISSDSLSYSEVGSMALKLVDSSFADVDTADSSAAERLVESLSVSVGRFVPDNFTASSTQAGIFATANAACTASGFGYTFAGQNFAWATPPALQLTARNAGGAITRNWTGTLMKLVAANHVSASFTLAGGGSSTLAATQAATVLVDNGNGQVTLTRSTADTFVVARSTGVPRASITPTLSLATTVADSAEVAIAGNNVTSVTLGPLAQAFNAGSSFHHGRLQLYSAHGDARVGVRLLVELQRFGSAGWSRMSEDRGCIGVQPAALALENPRGRFTGSGLCATPAAAGASPLRGGRAWLPLPASPSALPGALTARLNLGASASGTACTAAGAQQAAATMALPYLQSNWGGGATADQDPNANLTWGRANRELLMRSERFD